MANVQVIESKRDPASMEEAVESFFEQNPDVSPSDVAHLRGPSKRGSNKLAWTFVWDEE